MHQEAPKDAPVQVRVAKQQGRRGGETSAAPIKLPNPPGEEQAEIPKVGCRDAPGG